jgi:hypothetical protein
MNNEPKRQEPEITPPVPKGEPERLVQTLIRGEN